jgi:hypothetical protein
MNRITQKMQEDKKLLSIYLPNTFITGLGSDQKDVEKPVFFKDSFIFVLIYIQG